MSQSASLSARRAQLLLPASLAAAVIVLYSIDSAYPIKEWLLVRVLQYWGLALYWAAGCLSLGLEILERVAKAKYRPTEAPFVGFPLGVLAFAIVVFGVGLAGGLGKPFFASVPGIFFIAGYGTLRKTAHRLVELFEREPYRPSWVELGALIVLATGLVAVYVPILTPKNLQHDARWYHMPIAAQYVASGRIVPFVEGWLLGAYPHLTSLIYTWAISWPAGIVHRVELCAHIEFVVFVMTIAAMPAAVRRIVPGLKLPLASAAFFLFPGFLVYDSNLSGGADHFAALFAPAGLIVLFPALRTLGPRHVGLVAAMAAGAALTKYSALCVVAPLALVVIIRALAIAILAGNAPKRAMRLRLKALTAVGVLGATFAVLWAPHWLKNLVYYGDPLYPMLHGHLPLHPWDAQADFYFKVFIERALLTPSHGLAGLLESAWAASTLGLSVNEYGFHGQVPTFGFLFAATLYCLPFVSVGPRVWTVYGMGWVAGFVWYATNHRDRYLQAALPWLVAGTLAVLATIWEKHGKNGRIAAAVLVGVQLACGAGLALLPAHNMANNATALPDVISLIGAGYQGHFRERFQPDETWAFAAWTDIGRGIPKKAADGKASRVLVHEDRLWIGLDRVVVVDEAGWQAGIRYSKAKTPAQVWDILKSYGITHIVTGRAHADGGSHGMTGDLVFWEFLTSYATRIKDSGRLAAWTMPENRPPELPLGKVAILTCNQNQPLGVYAFDGITSRAPLHPVAVDAEAFSAAFAESEYVVNELNCTLPPIDEHTLGNYRFLGSRLNVGYWKKR